MQSAYLRSKKYLHKSKCTFGLNKKQQNRLVKIGNKQILIRKNIQLSIEKAQSQKVIEQLNNLSKNKNKSIMSYYHRDSLSIKSNKILANLFAQLIILSEKVQSFRQIIASVPYYDCVELFRILDKDEKGYLSLKDFTNLIGDRHKKIATYAFAWFDQAKLGEVSRLEFIAFLMPRRSQELREMVARRIEQPVDDENFSSTISEQLRIFTQLLNQIVSHELKVIQQRNSLLKQSDYSLKGVLNSLDVNAHEFVSTNDILKFLQNYAIQATKQQLEDLLEIVDSKLQGKINLNQLKWVIEGFESRDRQYREKINKSVRKGEKSLRRSQRKGGQIVNERRQDTVKEFVRTPLKNKEENYQHQRSAEQSYFRESTKKNQSRQQEKDQKYQQRAQSAQKPQLSSKTKPMHDENSHFGLILQRYRQAEAQAIQKDAELIRAQQQIKQKLREEFHQKSNSRRRAITESRSMASQSRRRPEIQYQPQENLKNDYARQPFLPLKSFQQPISSQPLYYQYPYTSQYDKKINTIVDNFYRRNNETDPLHSSVRRYGTTTGSFYDRERPVDSSYGAFSQDRRVSSTRKKQLDEELQIQRAKVRPFDHGSTLLKDEINKKLGDDIFSINLPQRAYDPLMHQARQKPLEDSIRRLKQTTDRIHTVSKPQERQKITNGMMENISIISKGSSKKVEESAKKPDEAKDLNRYRTEVKSKPASTPLSAYQTVYGRSQTNGDWTKSRGQRTTVTKYGQYE